MPPALFCSFIEHMDSSNNLIKILYDTAFFFHTLDGFEASRWQLLLVCQVTFCWPAHFTSSYKCPWIIFLFKSEKNKSLCGLHSLSNRKLNSSYRLAIYTLQVHDALKCIYRTHMKSTEFPWEPSNGRCFPAIHFRSLSFKDMQSETRKRWAQTTATD